MIIRKTGVNSLSYSFMASYLRPSFSPLSLPLSPNTPSRPITSPRTFYPIRCGPRNNRGPLIKGRTLSTEAIQAVQSLKRAHRAGSNDTLISATLSRLIKSDLIAAFNELLRQDHCHLALCVFSAVRSEYPTDLTAYADLVSALARKQLWHDIDRLILELEREAVIPLDDKGLVRLVKAVIGAGRGESTVRIYALMKRSGWRGEDEYLARVLSRGLRRFGEERLAREVDAEFGNLFRGILDKHRVESNPVS